MYCGNMNSGRALLREIEAAAAKLEWSPGYLCFRAVGNARLPSRLDKEGSTSLKTADKVRAFIEDRLNAVEAS